MPALSSTRFELLDSLVCGVYTTRRVLSVHLPVVR